jgi:3-phosphoshikimate 1-carboxyvinyltransferase
MSEGQSGQMNLNLKKSKINNQQALIQITGSKSESNRLLLLQALCPEITIENLSNSDDSNVMQLALSSGSDVIDVRHAGTAMRFLTAFFATQQGREIILTGSERMKERPIQILVEALNHLGADIIYLETKGCPPLKIKGKLLSKNKVSLKANISSQYISALLLMAPKLKNGLELTLEGKITSMPYIKMTLDLLNQIGVSAIFTTNIIKVEPLTKNLKTKTLTVESDWSSASYFYSSVALSEVGTKIHLASYKENSLQGDSVLTEIYKDFGVTTTFENNSITLHKSTIVNHQSLIKFDLSNSPDIAQTIAITCLGLGIKCHLTGLHTLKIKETDRLIALKTEIEKLGAKVDITDDALYLRATQTLKETISIETYNDHRMAMAFAPLALKTSLQIEDAMVVSKSYPTFWEDLKTLGFQIK